MSAPVPLAAIVAGAMSHADGCPQCPNSEPPRAAAPTREGWMCSYLCSDCGAAWTADYREDRTPVQDGRSDPESIPNMGYRGTTTKRALAPRNWRSATEGSDHHEPTKET